MTDVKVYGFPRSGFTRAVLLALEEKGVAYDLEGVEFGSDRHRALHPFARIPILVHDGFVLWESSAIVRFVDEAFDGPALQPREPHARARMNQWISAHNDYFVSIIGGELLMPRLLHPMRGLKVDEAKVAEALPRIGHQLSLADKVLSATPYFAGDQLSLADLVILPTLVAMEMTPEGERMLTEFGALARWRGAMKTRPSFAATMPPMPAQNAAE